MPDQFASGITGCPKCSDNAGFFRDRIAGCDAKYKCHDHNDDIQKHDHHCLIASHIVTGKNDRLILILWNKIFQCDYFSHCLHQIFGNIFFLDLALWLFIVSPGIVILEFVLIENVKFFLRYQTNTKFYCIKHCVAVVLKQAAVIGKCNEPCDRPGFCSILQRISDLQVIVIRIHTVDCDLACFFCQFSIHQADFVDICTVLEETHRTAIGESIFYIIVLIDFDAFFFDRFALSTVQPLSGAEVSIFDVVFFKSLIVCLDHTAICN